MNKERNQTISTRAISTTFVIVALAVFKPFGLDTWQWQAYVHLAVLWIIGISICMLTGLILKYVVRMPRSYEKGVEYVIRRNLWFQLINTPLVALSVCFYRHFVLSNGTENNQLSVVNFIESLLIIAFCSFTIGLYWRFKFRSKFLKVELEETKQLNDQLTKVEKVEREEVAEKGGALVLTGTTNDTVTLQVADLLYVEAVGNYVKVCRLREGVVQTDMLRATSKQIEDELRDYPMVVRCHRAFLVNLAQVEQVVSHAGSMQLMIKHSHDAIPVSRSNMTQVKETIKEI